MENCNDIKMPCDSNCPKAGYAFIPIQQVNRYYDYDSGLLTGTIFPDLYIAKGKYGPKEDAPQS